MDYKILIKIIRWQKQPKSIKNGKFNCEEIHLRKTSIRVAEANLPGKCDREVLYYDA